MLGIGHLLQDSQRAASLVKYQVAFQSLQEQLVCTGASKLTCGLVALLRVWFVAIMLNVVVARACSCCSGNLDHLLR